MVCEDSNISTPKDLNEFFKDSDLQSSYNSAFHVQVELEQLFSKFDLDDDLMKKLQSIGVVSWKVRFVRRIIVGLYSSSQSEVLVKVETVQDLEYVQETDLVELNPVQRRKLQSLLDAAKVILFSLQ